MVTNKVGVTDLTAGGGVIEPLVLGHQADSLSKLQAVDLLRGGEPFVMRSVSLATVIPPTVSLNVPAWHVITRRVPDGRFMVIDYATVQCSVADESWIRISRRYILGGNAATASPTAPSAPGVAAVTHDVGIDEANGSNTFSWKYSWVNQLGQESALSAASTTTTPTAAQKRVDVTIAALATGAVQARIYRSRPGQGATGPWYHLDDAPTGAYRDVHPDSDLDLARQHPGVTWGTAFSGNGPMAGIGSLVYINTVALAVAPATIVYTNQRSRRSSVAFAPGTAVTQLRVALSDEGRQWANTSAIATHPIQEPFISDFGATNFIGFNNTKANMGGTWAVYGIEPRMESHFEGAAPIAGGNAWTKGDPRIPFPSGSTMVVEAGGTATQIAGTREVSVYGRLFDNPI
jgi:hypothetical protein